MGRDAGFRISFAGAVLLLAAMLVGGSAVDVKAMASKLEAAVATETDDGSSVALRVGQALIVRLPSQPGTGFGWELEPGFEAVLALKEKTLEPGPGIPGAPQMQAFTFTAKSVGETMLELNYRRPWETETPPAKRYALAVKVER